MGNLTYDDYMQRLTVQDILKDAGYVRNRKDGMRYPSFVRLDEHGQRIRGDKFIVTHDGRGCFHPPVQKTYNIISLIKEHPDLFPEYEVGMNLDLLVNKVCCRLLNTTYEDREREIREPAPEIRPFKLDEYRLTRLDKADRETWRPFYPFFKRRGIDIRTELAFRDTYGWPRRDGSPAYKGKAAGSNGSAGLWIASPGGTELRDAKRVFLFESAYDAMAFFQLRREDDKGIGKAVFVSTGGNPTRAQMQGLLRTAPAAVFHLCFDNDEAGRQFAENFMTVAKEEKPHSDVAQAFKDTPGHIQVDHEKEPGHIQVDHEKESALFRLPKDVQQKYFDVEELSEDLREGYLCDEDKEDLRARIKEGYRNFFAAVDGLIIQVERELPEEGYKDFNDELLGKEMTERKAVGCDLDGDGAVETEESHEEKHKYHR